MAWVHVHLGMSADQWEELTQYEGRVYVETYGKRRLDEDRRDAERALFQAQMNRTRRLPSVEQLRMHWDVDLRKRRLDKGRADFEELTRGRKVVMGDGDR